MRENSKVFSDWPYRNSRPSYVVYKLRTAIETCFLSLFHCDRSDKMLSWSVASLLLILQILSPSTMLVEAWIARIDGDAADSVNSVSVDSAGNIIACGQSESMNLLFYPSSSTERFMFSAQGGSSSAILQQPVVAVMGFIVKYTPSGNALWAAKIQGTDVGPAEMIACTFMTTDTQNDEDVYAIGSYKSQSQVTFFNADGTPYRALFPTGTTSDNAFLIKYAGQTGQVEWIVTLDHATGNDYMTAVKTDRNGNIYVTGYYSATPILFKGATAGRYNQTVQTGLSDGYLARYRSNGDFVWVMTFGGNSADRAEAVDIDSAGNIYLGASITSSTNSVTLKNVTGHTWRTIPVSSNYDTFIARISPTGNYVWMARIYSASAPEYLKGLAVTRDGGLYVAGQMVSSTYYDLNFYHSNGSLATGFVLLNSPFFARYNSETGMFEWATKLFNNGVFTVNQVAADSNGNGIFVGEFANNYVPNLYDTKNSILMVLPRNGTAPGGYILKYSPNGTLLWTAYANGPLKEYFTGVAIDPRDNQVVSSGIFPRTTLDRVYFFDARGAHIGTINGVTGSFIYKLTSSGALSNEFSQSLISSIASSTMPILRSSTTTADSTSTSLAIESTTVPILRSSTTTDDFTSALSSNSNQRSTTSQLMSSPASSTSFVTAETTNLEDRVRTLIVIEQSYMLKTEVVQKTISGPVFGLADNHGAESQQQQQQVADTLAGWIIGIFAAFIVGFGMAFLALNQRQRRLVKTETVEKSRKQFFGDSATEEVSSSRVIMN